MTVSDFKMMSKGAGAASLNAGTPVNEPHEFTYIVADESQANFHAFFDEHETWINHRDNGQSLNVDEDIAKRLTGKSESEGEA